jgi:hypothetical protein
MQMYHPKVAFQHTANSDAWHGLLIAGKIGILKSVKMRAASEEFS